MKRVAICVPNPWDYISRYEKNYSIMILNPTAPAERTQYLLDNADWSIFVTPEQELYRDGCYYPNEKVFWYTSGTTGDSKFYGFNETQVNYVCQQIITAYNITANDRYVGVMGLWHAHGQMFYWMSKMIGCETTFLPTSEIKNVHTYSPTFLTGIPDILRVLAKQDLKDLRFIRSASSALPSYQYTAMKERFRVPIIESFGMTESCSHSFTNPLFGEQRIGTVGLPCGIDARIDDNSRLFIRGPCLAQSGWFDTGDLAEQDDAGYYRILGRSVDRINIRGYKLDPVSLENQMFERLPNLSQIAIFGRDRVKCIYVGEYTDDQIVSALKEIGPYCWPSLVEQVEDIPKNAAGKVTRTMLDTIY